MLAPRSIRFALHPLLAASLVFLMGADGDCGDPILENNGFDLWCGDALCHWEVEEGEIARIPTWHRADYGVELQGDAASISQLSEIGTGIECLRFEAVANIEESASVTVEVDFFDDGVADYSERIPTSSWEPVSFLVTPPVHYRGARFRIRKLGGGDAQLAQLVVESVEKCVEPPLEVTDRLPGAVCLEDEDCQSDLCLDKDLFGSGTCAECAGTDDCGAGEVCGLVEPGSPVQRTYLGCQDAGAKQLGEACAVGGECASGLCAGPTSPVGGSPTVCSACATNEDCGGEACLGITVEHEDAFWPVSGPKMCTPFAGDYASGQPCVLDESCASGECAGPGELRVCAGANDGRACTDDNDCYRDDPCVAIGTAGGTCR